MVEVFCQHGLKASGVPFVNAGHLQNGVVDASQMTFISEDHYEKLGGGKFRDGDILYCLRGSLGKAAQVMGISRGAIASSLVIIRLAPSFIGPFMMIYLGTSLATAMVRRYDNGTAQPNLSSANLERFLVPVPPLAEQRRIVAKVDELMALCDALERESADAMTAHQALVEELLGTLVNSADATDLATTWARLEQHFDTLFTTETSIDALKQTILDLAVRGKLVEQDAGDEAASIFIKKILAHKGRIERSARQRTEKFAQPANSLQTEVVPDGWALTRFGDIMISRDAERVPISSDDRARRQGEYDYYGASGVIDNIDDYLFDKPLLLIGEDGANLINRSTPIAFIATGKYWVNNHAHVLDAVSFGLLRYMELFINATDLKPYVTGTAQPKMNQAKMNSIRIALPPEAEQHRIVAKVDALMALCDALKARITDAATTQKHLADAIVERAAA